MAYNYVKQANSIRRSNLCKFDTNVGFETDFSVNGDVDGWAYYDGVHTYGCWNNFLFGTTYTNYAVVGRSNVFAPVLSSKDYYTVSITMRLKCKEREGSHALPITGKIMWRTLSDSTWDDDKSMNFMVYADNTWHIYNLNMGEAQWWQGDINDIRVYPFIDAMSGDEFFIQDIKIMSVNSYKCIKGSCSYQSLYSHPCGGIGSRFTCISDSNSLDLYTIEKDVNDTLSININNYGNEIIVVDPISNITGHELARNIAKVINKVGVGGYAEAEVEYDDENKMFYIYSGTYSDDSSIVINDSTLAEYIKFYISNSSVYSTTSGRDPADSFIPESSFLINNDQILSLFDTDSANINFNPSYYAIEGGRSDWLESSLGLPTFSNEVEDTNQTYVVYETINNSGKTIVDYNHPFNASGRVTNITIACTLDNSTSRGRSETSRDESTGCKVYILRPRKNGTLSLIHELDIPNRQQSSGALYSAIQEYSQIDCDIFVNKGDLIGVYNANIYTGLSIGGLVDAQYYHISGTVDGEFNPGTLYGDGSAGLLFYARSSFRQRTLALNVDLGHRINIDDVVIKGTYEDISLEFNIARCLDINWTVDLFGGKHETSHLSINYPGRTTYIHDNVAYGISNLSDGVYIVPEGKSADDYSTGTNGAIVPSNPHYFWVNGDCEWLGVFQQASVYNYDHVVTNYANDPIALSLLFPYNQVKNVYKSKIFFKEYNNFRSFALSTYLGDYDNTGNADDYHFNLIPEYEKIVLDGVEYYEGSDNYEDVNEYLFLNPCNGEPTYVTTLDMVANGGFWDGKGYGYISNFSEYHQAINTDWTVIEHSWEPVSCKGFRIYCDYHESTKITEIEVYCESDFEGTTLVNGIDVYHSKYNDLWWTSDLESYEDSVVAFVSDTSRYFRINLSPTSLINLENINFNVSTSEVFVGEKGCEDILLLENCKTDSNNRGSKVDLTNVYGHPYDLYVDILEDDNNSNDLIFHSKMDSLSSVNNPAVGPDATYYKEPDYILTMDNGNCAINCDCYTLKNLVEGKKAYYSYDDRVNWLEYGTLHDNVSNDFNNHAVEYSEMNLPVINRNRYWKLKPTCDDIEYDVREIRVFNNDVKLSADFYHDKTLDPYSGPISDTAPHLNNDSIVGSYYTIGEGSIGIDLGAPGIIDKIRIYHNAITDWSYRYGGIDKYTNLCLGVDEDDNIVDKTYNNQSFDIYGDVVIDNLGPFQGSNKPKAIHFGGTSSDYISIPYRSMNNLTNRRGNMDFWVKFDSLPTNNGDYVILMRNWGANLPPTFTNGTETLGDSCGFLFMVRNVSGFIRLEFHVVTYRYQRPQNHFLLYDRYSRINFTPGEWYHIAVIKSPYVESIISVSDSIHFMSCNNTFLDSDFNDAYYSAGYNYEEGYQNLIIGQGLHGSITDFRIMHGTQAAGDTTGVGREGTWDFVGTIGTSTSSSNAYMVKPTKPWEKYYTFDVFVSDDNISYGYHSTLDLWQEHSTEYYHYDPNNKYNYSYYSYFAIDLEKRYALDIIRSYGASDAFDLTGNILFSNSDVSNLSEVDFESGSIDDARWVIIRLLNDGVDKNIRKIGIYPDISTLIAPGGGYNKEWEYIGSSITDYDNSRNIALYADIEASSYWGNQDPTILVDGNIGEYISEAWLSDTSDEQYIIIDLGEVYEVYRFKLYHGYDDSDDTYIVQDYTIQTSVSGVSYDTQFSIIDNDDFIRIHDLTEPVEARYIKINITDYSTMYKYIRIGGTSGFFGGAVMRQIEVYNYYGFSILSSESSPVIAINLKDQFYINNHSLVGIDSEDNSTDWSNDNSNFTYTDSVFSDPRKISFNGWGALPNYEQWVAIKMDTATYHNSGPDYLKNVVISASDKPNPCDNDWWWVSRLSTVSRDYSADTSISVYGLKIEYPASSGIENVYLRDGDNFGIDETISWRDNFYFRLHIDDIDNLDLSYGYIYFGGNDTSHSKNVVSYQWYFNTLSGSLHSGWNDLILKFKDADYIEYTEHDSQYDDPRIFSNLTMSDVGLNFRGVGNPLVLRLDGFKIKRNHFDTDSRFSKGLYLTGNDYITCPFSNFQMSKGTIEFWLKPDYNSNGVDFFKTFKNRSLFNVININNDVLGVSITMTGFTIYFGKLGDTLTTYFVTSVETNVDELFHFAFVYSNTGKDISSDGSTIRLYLNNRPITRIMEPWVFGDSKYFKFTLGGEPPMAVKEGSSSVESSSIDAIISNLKIYNYCKTDFYNSMEYEDAEESNSLIKPSKLISISKDNLTYYNVGDSSLPFIFEKVPDGDSVPIYVKSNIPKGLTDKEKRTSGLVIQWDIGV